MTALGCGTNKITTKANTGSLESSQQKITVRGPDNCSTNLLLIDALREDETFSRNIIPVVGKSYYFQEME